MAGVDGAVCGDELYRRNVGTPAVPTLPCPNCQSLTPRQMTEPPELTRVNYYRCESCKHIWTTDKQTHQLIRHVTPLAPKRDDAV
jgi:hypothetical protein